MSNHAGAGNRGACRPWQFNNLFIIFHLSYNIAINKLQRLFRKKPYLAWDVKDKGSLSEKSILEHILNYGNWDDYLAAEKTLGLKKTKALDEELKKQKKSQLKAADHQLF